MLIHSFLTNGKPMFDFAKLFLQSFKYHNGDRYKIVFTGKDLSSHQIKTLKDIYPNLDIWNEHIDYEELSITTGYPIYKLHKIKERVENRKNGINRNDDLMWKQFISVDERYKKSIIDTVNRYEEFYQHVLHLDIDTCFFRDIEPIKKIVKNHDISFKWRYGGDKKKDKGAINKKIIGYCIGITINENSKQYIHRWINYINKVPLMKRQNGYGQSILFLAYKDLKKQVKFGSIPHWITSSNLREMKNRDKLPIIVGGNNMSKTANVTQMKTMYKGKWYGKRT